MELNKIYEGNSLEVLKTFPSESIDCCMTSPPYWGLRDYGVNGQLGLEPVFQEYITKLCNIFDEVKRVLKKSGTVWINIGDTYSLSGGPQVPNTINKSNKTIQRVKTPKIPPKCLVQIPHRFAIEMCNRGWTLRNTLIWHKSNCMPSSVKDRFTVDFEYIFFFTKSKKYFFEQQFEPLKESSIKRLNQNIDSQKGTERGHGGQKKNGNLKALGDVNKGRNMRCVWKISPQPFKEAHFAVFPEELCKTPIRAGCPIGGVVLDPFFGTGTTGLVALKQGKKFVGVELSKEYIKIAEKRLYPWLIQTKLFKE